MSRHPSLSKLLAGFGLLATAGVRAIALPPADFTTAVAPRQAATTHPPAVLDVRDALTPKLEVSYMGDFYQVPDDDNAYLILKDANQALLQPSAIIVKGQTVSLPAATRPTNITVGGLEFTVAPARSTPRTLSLELALKQLHDLASTIRKQVSDIQPQLDGFAAGITSAKDLQDELFTLQLAALLVNLDTFHNHLRGLSTPPAAEVRDPNPLNLNSFGPAHGVPMATAYQDSKTLANKLKSLLNIVKVSSVASAELLAEIEASWRAAAAAVTGGSAAFAIGLFAGIDWSAALASATMKDPPPSPTTTTDAAAETSALYFFTSKYGTDQNAFDSYCKGLDGLAGHLISRSGAPTQGYQTKLTQKQVDDVKSQPWYGFVSLVPQEVIPQDADVLTVQQPAAGVPLARSVPQQTEADNSSTVLLPRKVRPQAVSARQRALLSASKDENQYGDLPDQEYLLDDTAGVGVTIYIVDHGFGIEYQDLRSGPLPPDPQDKDTEDDQDPPPPPRGPRRVDTHIVPNDLTMAPRVLAGLDPEWSEMPASLGGVDDYRGHGTIVAIAAAGLRSGIAPRADLYLLKVVGDHSNKIDPSKSKSTMPPASIFDAINVIKQDVMARRLQGKAVVNMSIGRTYQRQQHPADPHYMAIFSDFERFCREQGVVWTVAAGNDGDTSGQNNPESTSGENAPQRLGTADNAMMTVGGVNRNGWLWLGTTPVGPARFPIGTEDVRNYPGNIDVYAPAEFVDLNVAIGFGPRVTATIAGTSLAAPLVAGLSAYFIKKTPTNVQFTMDIGREMKGVIRQQAVHWPEPNDVQPEIITANNGARSDDQALCKRDGKHAECHGEVANGPKPITPPKDAFTGKCDSKDVELAVYTDENCQDPFQFTVCVSWDKCEYVEPKFSSMRVLGSQGHAGVVEGGIAVAFQGPECTGATHGYNSFDQEGLKDFKKGRNNDGERYWGNGIKMERV